MRRLRFTLPGVLFATLLLVGAAGHINQESRMDLGDFSISLAVKDLAASRAFYEKLGFSVIDGKAEENWLILKNGTAKVGLFQGLFEQNILTFNPKDVRAIQQSLKAQGVQLVQEADTSTSGPAHIVVQDPDGNMILIDQF